MTEVINSQERKQRLDERPTTCKSKTIQKNAQKHLNELADEPFKELGYHKEEIEIDFYKFTPMITNDLNLKRSGYVDMNNNSEALTVNLKSVSEDN